MICEPCEVQYDLAEGENYIEPENRAAIEAWHDRGHVGPVFPKTIAEQLDAAQTGEEFGQVLQGLFRALDDASATDRRLSAQLKGWLAWLDSVCMPSEYRPASGTSKRTATRKPSA